MTAEARHSARPDPDDLVLRYLKRPHNDLRDAIVSAYTPMVEISARRYAGIEAVEDLIQVGYLGLLNALRKFDPNSGVKFATYASYLVSGEIKHYLRDRSQTIRQPAWLQELRQRVNRERTELQAALGRTPTENEIAQKLGCAVEAVVELQASEDTLRVGSLDERIPDTDGLGESDAIEVPETTGAFRTEDRLVLEEAIGRLKELERRVVVLFHFEAMNQTEIAKSLGISGNYVSYLLRQALAKLRTMLSSEVRVSGRTGTDDNGIPVWDDALDVYTESYFRARLQEEILRASDANAGLGLVFVGLDRAIGLTRTNANVSPDFVLSDIAARVRQRVRRTDIVARYGHRGFVVILPDAGSHTQHVRNRVFEAVREGLSEIFGADGAGTCTISSAEFPSDFHSYRDFLATERSSAGVA
ncbi:MAG: sigma-70 family RNA polymerase sigma factor [Fimbriimonadaceae bacterium]|nr:sigma-70 family RNA polymerase sigma factor [Fimbriimonadaceae bacterium]